MLRNMKLTHYRKWKNIAEEISRRGVEIISRTKGEGGNFCYVKWLELKSDYEEFKKRAIQKGEKSIKPPEYFRQIEKVLDTERKIGTYS